LTPTPALPHTELLRQHGSAQQGPRLAADATTRIPRVLHIFYDGGVQRMAADNMAPRSHFKKEWWASCKVRTGCAALGWLLHDAHQAAGSTLLACAC
jgi:hypothetical protein